MSKKQGEKIDKNARSETIRRQKQAIVDYYSKKREKNVKKQDNLSE